MDMEQFRTAKSAVYYRKTKEISDEVLESTLREMCSRAMGDFLYKVIRNTEFKEMDCKYSLVVFKYEKEPSFLPGCGLLDLRHGYVLIIENSDYLVLMKNGSSSITGLKHSLEVIDSERLKYFLAREAMAYPKITYGNMTASDRAIRKGSIEAPDCSEVFPVSNSNRKSIRGFKVETPSGNLNIAPGRSSIRQLGGSEALEKIMLWCSSIIDKLSGQYEKKGFFTNFSQDIKFSDLPSSVLPTGILFDLSDLEENIMRDEDPWILYTKLKGKELQEAGSEVVKEFFSCLKDLFRLTIDSNGNYFVSLPDGMDSRSGILASVKKQARSYKISSAYMRKFVFQNQEGKFQTIESYIHLGKHYSISYSDPTFFFSNGSLLQDAGISAMVDKISSTLIDKYDLSQVSSEKGSFDKRSTKFSSDSLFHFVETSLVDKKSGSTFLVCDDLGDEWADYISFNCDQERPSISFFHAKSKKEMSTGASQFHDIVGQALKNLGRTNMNAEDFKRKLAGWDGFYSNSKIKKIRTPWRRDDIVNKFERTLSSPYLFSNIYLVVSFVSKKDILRLFGLLKEGNAPAHITQLVWLLASFISECQNVNARPYIICKP